MGLKILPVRKMPVNLFGLNLLTYLSQDKMAAILADDNFKCIFLNENDKIPIWISLKSVPVSLIGN